jgi:hypothetical protein
MDGQHCITYPFYASSRSAAHRPLGTVFNATAHGIDWMVFRPHVVYHKPSKQYMYVHPLSLSLPWIALVVGVGDIHPTASSSSSDATFTAMCSLTSTPTSFYDATALTTARHWIGAYDLKDPFYFISTAWCLPPLTRLSQLHRHYSARFLSAFISRLSDVYSSLLCTPLVWRHTSQLLLLCAPLAMTSCPPKASTPEGPFMPMTSPVNGRVDFACGTSAGDFDLLVEKVGCFPVTFLYDVTPSGWGSVQCSDALHILV